MDRGSHKRSLSQPAEGGVNGLSIEPYDEDRIDGEDNIIRRVNPTQHVIWDENRQSHRISSKLYSKSSGLKEGMSVDIEALILADGLPPLEYVTTPVYTGSVVFTASNIRALDLFVGYDPIKDTNPYHGEVWTKAPAKRFSKSQKDGLAKFSSWYVALPDVEII